MNRGPVADLHYPERLINIYIVIILPIIPNDPFKDTNYF